MDGEVAQKKEKAKIPYRPYACSIKDLLYFRKKLWRLRTSWVIESNRALQTQLLILLSQLIRTHFISVSLKTPMEAAEAHQYTALSCFTVLIYKFSSISCTYELWKILLLKTKRKDKMTNPRLRDPSAKILRLQDVKISKKQDFETHKKRFRYRTQYFPKPTSFEVPFFSP